MIRITLEHTAGVDYCNRGTRAFCKKHGIDINRLRKEGIPIEELEHIDDEMLHRVLRLARKVHGIK